MKPVSTRPLVVMLIPAVAACATIEKRPPRLEKEEVTRVELVSEIREGGPITEIHQDGTNVALSITHACASDEVEFRTVRHQYVEESYNKSSNGTAFLAVMGAVSGGLGAAFMATPSTFASKAQGSGSFSSNDVFGTGVALGAIGGLALVIAGVDVLRASHEERYANDTRERGNTRARDVRCPGRAYAGAEVTGSFRGQALTLGTTGGDGSLNVDLLSVVSESVVVGAPIGTLSLAVGGHPVGTVSLRPLVERYDEAAWGVIDSADLRGCAETALPAACARVNAYVASFPKGAHQDDAQRALRKYQAILEEQQRRQREEADRQRRKAEEEQVRLQEIAAREELDRQTAVARRIEAETREAAAAERRRSAAQRAAEARQACGSTCASQCQGDGECRAQCVAQHCP